MSPSEEKKDEKEKEKRPQTSDFLVLPAPKHAAFDVRGDVDSTK